MKKCRRLREHLRGDSFRLGEEGRKIFLKEKRISRSEAREGNGVGAAVPNRVNSMRKGPEAEKAKPTLRNWNQHCRCATAKWMESRKETQKKGPRSPCPQPVSGQIGIQDQHPGDRLKTKTIIENQNLLMGVPYSQWTRCDRKIR